MRNPAPALLPIFRSKHQAELLAWLLMHPNREYTLTDLSQRLAAPPSTLHKEVARLTAAGLLESRKLGNARLLKAAVSHPASRPLTELLELTFGALPVVKAEFSDLPGASQVIIYGSWAARYEGTPGPPPNDLDVMVIGKPQRSEMYAAADRAQARLGVEVNTTVRTASAWEGVAPDPLSAEIHQKPHLVVWQRVVPDHNGDNARRKTPPAAR